MARNRSLAEINHKILKRSTIINDALAGILEKKKCANVLEVGFGEGRPLMELAWKFQDQDVRFFGIDKKQIPPVQSRDDLWKTAYKYEITTQAASPGFVLPEIFFYDAANMHFEDESMDLIYSAVTIRFIEDKAAFFESVGRVLRPGGVALLQIGEANWNYPYSKRTEDDLLTPYLSRFVLKYNDELIPLPAYLKLFEGNGFRFKFINGKKCVLRITKLSSEKLSLGLRYNDLLSQPMFPLMERYHYEDPGGGFRSVYDMAAENYHRLFSEGFLHKEQFTRDVKTPEKLKRRMYEEN